MKLDIAMIISRIKNILLAPKDEWPLIAKEKTGHTQLLIAWLLPLSLVSAGASFIGFGIVGFSVGGVHFASVSYGLRMAVLQILTMLGGAYITAFIIDALAEKFASEKNLDKAFALIAYSYAPACLGGLFNLIPSLAFIGSLIGLYSLYLLYIGLQPMMKTPSEKNTIYFVVSLLCALGVFIVLGAVLSAVLRPTMPFIVPM